MSALLVQDEVQLRPVVKPFVDRKHLQLSAKTRVFIPPLILLLLELSYLDVLYVFIIFGLE